MQTDREGGREEGGREEEGREQPLEETENREGGKKRWRNKKENRLLKRQLHVVPGQSV